MPLTRLYTLRELVAASGGAVKLSTLRAQIKSGDLAVVRTQVGPTEKRRTSGKLLVAEADWEAWVLRHRTPAKHEAVTPTESASYQRAQGARRAPASTVHELRGADRYAH